MGILDFTVPAVNNAPAATGRRQSTAEAPLPKAKIWLNAGYASQDDETGEEIFVNLPYGIALDTMAPLSIDGQSTKRIKLRSAQNHLMTSLQARADQLEDGEEIIVNLQLRMRKTKSELKAPAADDNSFIGALDNLFSPVAKVEAAE